ncbi:MAG TPA: hypothetical protein VKH36_06285, partial [Acidimicrobiia bacterium]|nr:hypothetical protein [Acidimicrobiia bacterium]
MKALEIWNEPNLTFYGMPAPDPAAYAAFLGAAHDAIKAADPTSAVITGGLAPAENQPRSQAMNPLLHVRAVYRAGGGKFDALGYHPYTYPAMLTDDPGDGPFVTTTPKLHDEMAKHGDRQSRCGARRWARPHSRPRGRRSWRSTSPGRTAAAIGGRSPA